MPRKTRTIYAVTRHSGGLCPQKQPKGINFACCCVQDSIAVLDDLLQHALEGLQVKAQLDTGTLPKKAPMQTAMKVSVVTRAQSASSDHDTNAC